MKRMKCRWILLLLLMTVLALALSSCGASIRRGAAYSYSGPVPERTASAIAQDAAALLARRFPPGHTAVVVRRPVTKDGRVLNDDVFGRILESKLRAHGFKISPAGTKDAREVVWTVDALGAPVKKQLGGNRLPPDAAKEMMMDTWYLRLQVSDTERLRLWTRVYDSTGVATGGFSQKIETMEEW